MAPAYEVINPSFPDMDLDEQIDAGINDWVADGYDGPFYGQSKGAAEKMRRLCDGCS